LIEEKDQQKNLQKILKIAIVEMDFSDALFVLPSLILHRLGHGLTAHALHLMDIWLMSLLQPACELGDGRHYGAGWNPPVLWRRRLSHVNTVKKVP
jgi:hypothetical protein